MSVQQQVPAKEKDTQRNNITAAKLVAEPVRSGLLIFYNDKNGD
jgi:hypothetical protein